MKRVSNTFHKLNKPVAELITNKLKSTNFDNPSERQKLAGWLNGVKAVETNQKLKNEIESIRQYVRDYID